MEQERTQPGTPGGGSALVTPAQVGAELPVALGIANVGFYVASIGVVLVVLAGDLGIAPERLSWLGSAFRYGLVLVAGAGPFALRGGERLVLTVSAVMLGVGSLLVVIARGELALYSGAMLQGLGAAGMVLVAPGLLHGPDAAIRLTRVNAVASVVAVSAPILLGLAATVGLGARVPLLLIPVSMVVLIVVTRRLPAGDPHAAARAKGRSTASWPQTLRRWLALVCSVSVEFAFVVWGVARLTAAGRGAGRAAVVGASLPGAGGLSARLRGAGRLVSVDFASVVWGVARPTAAGLEPGLAAVVGASFQVGMALGRVAGPRLITRLPMVLVGSLVAAGGSLLVVLASVWPLVGLGEMLAGFGVATLYPLTLAALIATPGLRPELGASLGALASGTAITLAPAALAGLALVMDLRVAFLVPLPILTVLLLLHYERRRPGA